MSDRTPRAALERLAAQLTTEGLPAECYTIAAFEGFGALTSGRAVDVHCLESRLGKAPGRPGYSSYAVAQTFLTEYPTLALTFLVELADADRRPNPQPPRFGLEVDRKFSLRFLPAMFSGLNQIDPTGAGRGQLVQSYHAEIMLRDFLHSSVYSAVVLRRYALSGQLALIAVDYNDPMARVIAGVLGRLRRFFPNIHMIPRASALSTLKLPVRGPGAPYLVEGSSISLDEGFRLARSYLDAHRQSATGTQGGASSIRPGERHG